MKSPLSDGLVTALRGRYRRVSPAQFIALSFALAIIIGTFLLSLPVAHAPGVRHGLLTALFTATSALCVTGLIVVDTATEWSRFGQTVIMLLIQAGGFGILTLGTFLAFFIGRRVGFEERMRLQAQVNSLQIGGVVRLIRGIALLSLGVEFTGALLLWLRFAPLHGLWEGAFYAVFHSISAFNNAGFALYSDSLMSFQGDVLVNFTIIALFVTGGLGYLVIVNLTLHTLKPRRYPLALQTKIVLVSTFILVVGGFLGFGLLEWFNPLTLGDLPLGERFLATFFQALTPRTAGFNSLDYGSMNDVTLFFTMLLMFIGANPGSTGGGIKTVTFFVLVGSAFTLSRGRGELSIFRRRIPLQTLIRASVISVMSLLLISIILTLLSVTDSRLGFLQLAFETVSAFATVGLSTGITAELSTSGQLVIILLMYLGRIGPLTFALALIEKNVPRPVTYPAEDVSVG